MVQYTIINLINGVKIVGKLEVVGALKWKKIYSYV